MRFCLDSETPLILDYNFIGEKLETGVRDTKKEDHGLSMKLIAKAVGDLVFKHRWALKQVEHFFMGRGKVNTELKKEVCQKL